MRFPRGLLSMFESKALGKNPPSYEDEVRLVSNMYEHYLPIEELVVDTTGSPIAAEGAIGPIVIPNSEVWILRSLSFVVGFSAGGGNQRIALLAFLAGAPLTHRIGNPVEGGVAATQFLSVAWNGTHLYGPGTSFFGSVDLITGSLTASLTATFNRLTV